MKATRKGVLGRLFGRKVKATDSRPVVTDVVPDADLSVHETEGFQLLGRAINRADHLDIKASTRRAAMDGMSRLAESDPGRMREIIREAGACGAASLRAAIMELAAVGRARS